jgi:hypothetical protein
MLESIEWYTAGMGQAEASKVARSLDAPLEFVKWCGSEPPTTGEYLQRMAAAGWIPWVTRGGKHAARSPIDTYVELGKIRHAYLVALVARLQSPPTVEN